MKPLGRKVFGIGYRRSGSKSLSVALRRLGYRSVHWEAPDGMKLPEIVKANHDAGRRSFEGYENLEAFTDYPVYDMAVRLKEEYPDALFVATYRPPDQIADSWERKMKREGWESGKFDNYGIYRPDRNMCYRQAREHYEHIKLHFGNDPNCLLFDSREGWSPLCHFLGVVGIPTGRYSHIKH